MRSGPGSRITTMSVNLFLYTRENCHLCDLADALVRQVAPGADVQAVDIDENLELLSRYGDRVPVLRRADTRAELGWPFDAEALEAFLA